MGEPGGANPAMGRRAKNDELSTWFLDNYEETQVGMWFYFVPIKEIEDLYYSQPIYTSMRKEGQCKFSTKKLQDRPAQGPRGVEGHPRGVAEDWCAF